MLAGAGLLWLGWSGFNGGGVYSANTIASLAVMNTHICAATSVLVWLGLDTFVFEKPSLIGGVQGMITGLVCITPAAGTKEATVYPFPSFLQIETSSISRIKHSAQFSTRQLIITR